MAIKDLIIVFDTERIIQSGAIALQNKLSQPNLPCGNVCIDKKPISNDSKKDLEEAITTLNDRGRVYIQGHGNWQQQTLNSWTGKEVADVLLNAGIKSKKDIRVSVLGCSLGRDVKDPSSELKVSLSTSSFAGDLHQSLKDGGCNTVLHARLYNVGISRVINKGRKGVFEDNVEGIEENIIHKKPQSKVTFKWNGDIQERWWSYQEKKVIDDFLDDELNFDFY